MEYEKVAQMPCLHGLHLRSSANLGKLAQGFSSEVRLSLNPSWASLHLNR